MSRTAAMVSSLRGGRSLAAALSAAWTGRLAPGMAQVTASNIRIQRRAICAMVAPSGSKGRSSSTAARKEDRLDEAAELLMRARRMVPTMPRLALECCQALLDGGRLDDLLHVLSELPEEVKGLGRLKIIEGRDDLAFTWSIYKGKGKKNGKSFKNGAVMLTVFRKQQDGKWKIVCDIWSYDK